MKVEPPENEGGEGEDPNGDEGQRYNEGELLVSACPALDDHISAQIGHAIDGHTVEEWKA